MLIIREELLCRDAGIFDEIDHNGNILFFLRLNGNYFNWNVKWNGVAGCIGIVILAGVYISLLGVLGMESYVETMGGAVAAPYHSPPISLTKKLVMLIDEVATMHVRI